MQPEKTPSPLKTRELKGRHVLMMLVAFFGVIIGVNSIFITKAVTSFTGEDVKRSYRQGLDYNQTLQSRSAQADLGWNVKTNLIKSGQNNQQFIVRIVDSNNRPVTGVTIQGVFNRPTDLAKDVSAQLSERGDGIYEVNLDLSKGQWILKATAISSGQNFRFEDRFVIL